MLLVWVKKYGLVFVGLFFGDGDSVKVMQLDVELGYVGLVQLGFLMLINILLVGGYLLVVSFIGVIDEGQLMNVNVDQVVMVLVVILGVDLILLFDVSGIFDGKGQCIVEMIVEKVEQLIEQGIIIDGMIVKVNVVFDVVCVLGCLVDIVFWCYVEQLLVLFNGMLIGICILV